MFARRENSLQEKGSIVVTARAIAWPGLCFDQIKVKRCPGARKVAIVHAEQANPAERHRPQGGQTYKANPATHARTTSGTGCRIQQVLPMCAHDGEVQFFIEARSRAIGEPNTQRIGHSIEPMLFLYRFRREELFEQERQALAPQPRCCGALQHLPKIV